MIPLLDAEPHDAADARLAFCRDAVAGLSAQSKTLPCKYFYDERGSALFDEICSLPEYYPTQTEIGIMREHAASMASRFGKHAALIEYGSGSSVKTRILLDHAPNLSTYIPVDISREHLYRTAAKLRLAYPSLDVRPVCADYTKPFALPGLPAGVDSVIIYFPGSTIGNFHPDEAISFLRSMAAVSGRGGGLLIGVDLRKELSVLEPAYNDARGVTAAFNRNILLRLNSELNATFDIDRFAHLAYFNRRHGRIEMHLVSDCEQEAWIGNSLFQFAPGESIWTESSYKYSMLGMGRLAEAAGWRSVDAWTDKRNWFSVQYLIAV